MKIVFFGSFQHYSAKILASLVAHSEINVVAVVTTPPMPVGRKQIITKTPVHVFAEEKNIPVHTPESLGGQPQGFAPTDYFVTAGYGKILSKGWLDYPAQGSLNLHFSLLPAYRGANPAEWAIMCGETQTGITLMQMNEGLDTGAIIQQASIPIEETDTRETLYDKLYTLGAEKLSQWIIDFSSRPSRLSRPQSPESPTPYAALLKRDDGFIPWITIKLALQGQSLKVDDFPSKKLQKALTFSQEVRKSSFADATADKSGSQEVDFLYRLPRALAGYPSLWTIVQTSKGEKRMKILSLRIANGTSRIAIEQVQLEGQQPTYWNQIKNQIQ